VCTLLQCAAACCGRSGGVTWMRGLSFYRVLCASHCNTLRHAATHRNTVVGAHGEEVFLCIDYTLQRTATPSELVLKDMDAKSVFLSCALCTTLQHTATHCNTLQHTATHCNTLQHTANEWLKNIDERWVFLSCTLCNTLHHSATHYKRAVEKYG